MFQRSAISSRLKMIQFSKYFKINNSRLHLIPPLLKKITNSNVPTSVKYPKLERRNYAVLSNKDISFFSSILESNQIITDGDELSTFNRDWTGSLLGSSQLLLKPKTTKQVSQILSYCHQHKIAVVPQGGNTGLVGGSVPVFDEVILSLGLMTSVISVDALTGIVVVESGVVLEKLQQELEKHNLIVPLDLGAKGSCMIGGSKKH